MPSLENRQFIEIEKPIKELVDELKELKQKTEKNPKVDYSSTIQQLEQSITDKRNEITQHLTSWQKVQLSRHPDRPYTLKFIEKMCTNFVEIFGDRGVKDDKAMVGGFAQLDGETVMMIGQRHGGSGRNRNAFVGRAKQQVEINAAIHQRLRIETAQQR